ncbi:MAG: cation diffusion facilitator family transporter [Candidatus Omnitrophota bacterium]
MQNALQQHYSYIRRTLIIILILNWAVALAKIIYGLVSRCTSMTADGFHSLSDGAANIIGIVGIHFACQPKDKDHPYGHKKYETFFSLVIAALLFILAFNLAREGFEHIRRPVTPRIDAVSFIIMIFTTLVNLGVVYYERRKGENLKSDILISDSMHTTADIFTSLSVIISLVVIKMGFPVIDPIATILISLFIAYAGYNILKNSSSILCDSAAILDEKKIEEVALGVNGVIAAHKIRSRGRPDDIHIDLHVQVDRAMHMDRAHKISYAIEEAIKKNIPGISDVVIHMEPKEEN